MHFHMNEQIDDGRPVNNGTASDRDTLADALLAIVPAFAQIGWELTSWEILDLNGTTHAEFTTAHDDHMHTLTLHIWGCECSTGEHEIRRAVAHLN